MTEAIDTLTQKMEEAVIAGAHAMRALVDSGTAIETHRKADKSFVLNLDLASQKAMRKILDPVLSLVSEEDPATHKLLDSENDYLIIDPLDGTSSCRRCLMNHGKFVSGNVGFGPMVGLVQSGELVAAAYLNLPDMVLYTAQRGRGAFCSTVGDDAKTRHQVIVKRAVPLHEAAALYYPGKNKEMSFTTFLRENDIIEGVYRFGAFANDCTRLALGFEQIEIQFSLRAWDLTAGLIAEEAGCTVIVDPFGTWTKLKDWRLRESNPALIVAPELEAGMREACERFKKH